MMWLSWRNLARVAGFAMLVAVGASVGGMVGKMDMAEASRESVVACERDRCVERAGECADAGLAETLCNLHAFGCGTVPCGMTFDELARFDRPDAPDLWMAWGPRAIPRLVDLAAVDGDPRSDGVRAKALATLARMASEWNVHELRSSHRRQLSRLAVAYTRRPLDEVVIPERTESLLLGIDLASALARDLDNPYHRQSVRLLMDPDTVRNRLADVRLSSDSAVEAIVRYAGRAR